MRISVNWGCKHSCIIFLKRHFETTEWLSEKEGTVLLQFLLKEMVEESLEAFLAIQYQAQYSANLWPEFSETWEIFVQNCIEVEK